jgi:DNA-directed RNA polymerase subunit RPC12/RpoP
MSLKRLLRCSECNMEKKSSEINKSTAVCFECEYRRWCKLILGKEEDTKATTNLKS